MEEEKIEKELRCPRCKLKSIRTTQTERVCVRCGHREKRE